MSENVEGAAARRAAGGAGRSSGAVAGIVGYMLGRGGKKGKGGGGGPKTAADYHNEEIARRYEDARADKNTRRDWGLGEKSKLYDWQRSETSADTQMNRDTFMAEESSRRRRTDLGHALRTGAKYTAGDINVGADGGFSVSGTGPGAKPLKAVTPPKPRAPRASTTTTTGSGRAGSARDAIVPSKSTVPKGKQFPGSTSGTTSVGGSAPIVY